MLVSDLKKAADEFIRIHGDGKVKLIWEEGALTEGFYPQNYEEPTDIRMIKDWPLPGESMLYPAVEDAPTHFVMMYGELGAISKGKKSAWSQTLND